MPLSILPSQPARKNEVGENLHNGTSPKLQEESLVPVPVTSNKSTISGAISCVGLFKDGFIVCPEAEWYRGIAMEMME